MASVKQKNTTPEVKVRSFLHRLGFRFRLHDPRLPGKPDLVFPMYKTVLFVHGCFWHGHSDQSCKLSRIPKSNIKFWETKISTNRERDKRNANQLRKLGWRVVIIWECQIGKAKMMDNLIKRISNPVVKC